MIEVVSRNFLLKLMSLGASAALFVMLNADTSTPIEVEAPVRYVVPDDFMVTGTPPSRVRLTLEGPWANLRQYEIDELEPITVNLRDVTEPMTARHFVELDDVVAPFGLKATVVRPSEFDVSVDEKVERMVAVEPSVPGRPGFGYELIDYRASPTEVKVVGPKNIVYALDMVKTYPVDVTSAESDVTMDVELRFPQHPAYLEKRTVTVTAEIREEFVRRSFLSVPVVLTPSSLEYRPEPAVVNITLRGPRLLLDRLDPKVIKLGLMLEPQWSEGLRKFKKPVELLQPSGSRLELVGEVPEVEVVAGDVVSASEN